MKLKPPIKAIEFNLENFAKCISEFVPDLTISDLNENTSFKYYYSYLKGENLKDPNKGYGCTLIVCEDRYISQSYFEDYSRRYARKFVDYAKYTRRLHFIESRYGPEEFDSKFVRGESEDDWTIGYIGYIVIKPVTKYFFGATLLKPYPQHIMSNDDAPPYQNHDLRVFNCLSKEKVHLLGRTIKLKSLAFQAHDLAVGSCATNALWASFHRTSKIYHTSLPSPYQITAGAEDNTHLLHDIISENAFGFSDFHVTKTLSNMGLSWDSVTQKRNGNISHRTIKSIVHAYNGSGIPVLLGFQIESNDVKAMHHLVTVSGYKINTKLAKSETVGAQLWSDNIEKLYIHDDLVGPFARLTFTHSPKSPSLNDALQYLNVKIRAIELQLKAGAQPDLPNSIDVQEKQKSTETLGAKEIEGTVQSPNCKPTSLIIPLHNSVTLHFDSIKRVIDQYDYLLQYLWRYAAHSEGTRSIAWDVHITLGTKYTSSIQECSFASEKMRIRIKNTSYPLYIWVGRIYDPIHGNVLADLVFDSTDVPQGFNPFQINMFNAPFRVDCANDLSVLSETYDKIMEKDRLCMPSIGQLLRLLICAVHDEDISNHESIKILKASV